MMMGVIVSPLHGTVQECEPHVTGVSDFQEKLSIHIVL